MNNLALILSHIGSLFAIIGAIAGWRFVWEYRRADWDTSEAGRNLMQLAVGISVILTYVIVFSLFMMFFESNWVVELVVRVGRMFIFGWIAWRLVSLIRVLRYYQAGGDSFEDVSEHKQPS